MKNNLWLLLAIGGGVLYFLSRRNGDIIAPASIGGASKVQTYKDKIEENIITSQVGAQSSVDPETGEYVTGNIYSLFSDLGSFFRRKSEMRAGQARIDAITESQKGVEIDADLYFEA